MARRFLIAPDKFKGSLSAPEAAAAMAEGVLLAEPDALLDVCPIADGGEGFMETLMAAMNGEWVHCPAVDALGRGIESKYVLAKTAEGPVAVMEMAETAGLWRLAADEKDPLNATTRGVGMQMAHAVAEHAVTRIIMGIGGSATNDGGSGMAAALGIDFLDGNDEKIDPNPARLPLVRRIDGNFRLALPEVICACDVDNPLLGERGATAVFSGQKGATEEDKVVLEKALEHLVSTSGADDAAVYPGAGAAGGLGFGLLYFAEARLISGFDLLAGLLGLEERIRMADRVITGEGSIDHQSLGGKGPVALAKMANATGVPVTGFCGVADAAARESGIFEGLYALADTGLEVEVLMRDAGVLLREMVRGNVG